MMKCGMSCSLFEVVEGKGKPTSGSLAALVNKLERDRMVSQFGAFKSPPAGNLAGILVCLLLVSLNPSLTKTYLIVLGINN